MVINHPPKFRLEAFSCPNCGVLTTQKWNLIGSKSNVLFDTYIDIENILISTCSYCRKYAIWEDKKMIFPLEPKVEAIEPPPKIQNPNQDLNKHIRKVYNEARKIVSISPNGACALLRLALEMLCDKLIQKEEQLEENTLRGKIKHIVKEKGLNPELEQAFHIVRIVGNEVVHSGQTDLKDNREIAIKLFEIINIIAEDLITKKEKIKKLYREVSKKKKEKTVKKEKK